MIPPEPGPDPPTPVTTYSFTANITYSYGTAANVAYVLSLSYKETAESDWVLIDTANMTSGAVSSTASAVLNNIPEGCHSVKLAISVDSSHTAQIKNAGSSWVTELTYGSGNEGWNQDYDSDVNVKVY